MRFTQLKPPFHFSRLYAPSSASSMSCVGFYGTLLGVGCSGLRRQARSCLPREAPDHACLLPTPRTTPSRHGPAFLLSPRGFYTAFQVLALCSLLPLPSQRCTLSSQSTSTSFSASSVPTLWPAAPRTCESVGSHDTSSKLQTATWTVCILIDSHAFLFTTCVKSGRLTLPQFCLQANFEQQAFPSKIVVAP